MTFDVFLQNKKLASHADDLESRQQKSTARYAELYQQYMQTRKEKAALEKQVFFLGVCARECVHN